MVFNRVAPRLFKGVIISCKDTKEREKLKSDIVEIMKKKGKDLLPIYDEKGNLLWPQEIYHEDIVKMKEQSEQK